MSVDSPLYLRSHSKAVLTQAITNDTHFLSSQLVMDYSLLVGIDNANKELIVGIIGNLISTVHKSLCISLGKILNFYKFIKKCFLNTGNG